MLRESKLPVFGQPIFVITENQLSDRVQLIGERGILNTLTYFAANAIMVNKIEFEDAKMRKVIINKDMVDENDQTVSLEIRIDLGKEKEDHLTTFVDETEAQKVAKQMNINQQKQCKKLVDVVNLGYNEYEKIIAACSTK